jgi:hypothetical protein
MLAFCLSLALSLCVRMWSAAVSSAAGGCSRDDGIIEPPCLGKRMHSDSIMGESVGWSQRGGGGSRHQPRGGPGRSWPGGQQRDDGIIESPCLGTHSDSIMGESQCLPRL